MNRDIIFRGKSAHDQRWVKGSLIVGPDWYAIWNFNMSDDEEVFIDTIGQYTGLTDKNGVKIFDGDILAGATYPFTHDGERNYYAVVVWFENSPAFGIETVKAPGSSVSGISAGNTDYMDDWDPRCWEVIGNIHDNPELLKEVDGNG